MQPFTLLLTSLAGLALASPVTLDTRQSCRDLTCSFTGTLLRVNQVAEWTKGFNSQSIALTGTGTLTITSAPVCSGLTCSAAIKAAKSNTSRQLKGLAITPGYAHVNWDCQATATSC